MANGNPSRIDPYGIPKPSAWPRPQQVLIDPETGRSAGRERTHSTLARLLYEMFPGAADTNAGTLGRRLLPPLENPAAPPSPFPGMMGQPFQQRPIPPEALPEQYLNFTQPGGQLGGLLGAQATQQVMEDLPGSIEQRTAELQLQQIKDKRAEAEKMRKQLQTLGRK